MLRGGRKVSKKTDVMEKTSAVILAAGTGSRLGRITENTPKPLLRFKGRPFLEYLIRWLNSSGVEDIVVVSSTHIQQFEGFFEERKSRLEHVRLAKLETLKTSVESAELGLKTIDNSRSFIVTSDSLWAVDLKNLLASHVACSALATVLLTARSNFANQGAVKVSSDDSVVQTWPTLTKVGTEKPVRSGSTMGLYLVNRDAVLSAIRSGDSSIEREPIGRLIPQVHAVWNEDYFLDYGTPDNYKLLYDNPELIEQCWGKLF